VIKQVAIKIKKFGEKPAICPNEEELAAYIEGRLAHDGLNEIEEHLAACAECTETIISLAAVDSTEKLSATDEMIKKAKALKKPGPKVSVWEILSGWFNILKPVPVMATVSVMLALVIFSVYNLQGSGIELNIIARMPSGIQTRGTISEYNEIEIKNGETLKSGDLFKIQFQLKEAAYVYLLSKDSQGKIIKLYQAEETGLPEKLEAQKAYFFPKNRTFLKLDSNTGQEAFYLLASPDPIEGIDKKIDQLKKSGIDNIENIFPGIKIQSFSFKHE